MSENNNTTNTKNNNTTNTKEKQYRHLKKGGQHKN